MKLSSARQFINPPTGKYVSRAALLIAMMTYAGAAFAQEIPEAKKALLRHVAAALPPLVNPDQGLLMLHPITLRNAEDRYVMPAVGSESPYYVLKSQPNASESKRIWSSALDHGVAVLADVDPGNPRQLVSVRLAVPEDQLGKWCWDAPRFTREFWTGQAPMPTMKTDRVLWIARESGCRVYHIHLQRRDGPYYLHEEQPNAQDMLQRAQESIDRERDVRWARCDGVFDFICALDPSPRPEAPQSDVLSEVDLGVVELRLGQPRTIDSGNVLLELVKSEDYRAAGTNKVKRTAGGHATATIAVRIGNRDIDPFVLSTTAKHAQRTSIDLPVPASSALRQWEYHIALRSIDQAEAARDPRMPSHAAVHVAVIRREKAPCVEILGVKVPYVEIWGDLSRLSRSDARFVEYWGTIASSAEKQGLPPRQLTAKEYWQEKTTGVLVASEMTLRLIRGFSVTLEPNSTGALEVSFYKSDADEYFFRQAGGCIEHRDLLFGPFREDGAGFSATGKR
jgi:hypothetical protein